MPADLRKANTGHDEEGNWHQESDVLIKTSICPEFKATYTCGEELKWLQLWLSSRQEPQMKGETACHRGEHLGPLPSTGGGARLLLEHLCIRHLPGEARVPPNKRLHSTNACGASP